MRRRPTDRLTDGSRATFALLAGLVLTLASAAVQAAEHESEAERQLRTAQEDLEAGRHEQALAATQTCVTLDKFKCPCWKLQAETAVHLVAQKPEERGRYIGIAEFAVGQYRGCLEHMRQTDPEMEEMERHVAELRAPTDAKPSFVVRVDAGLVGSAQGSAEPAGRASGFGGLAGRLLLGLKVDPVEISFLFGVDARLGGPPASMLVEPSLGLQLDIQASAGGAWMYLELGLSPTTDDQGAPLARIPGVFRAGGGPRFTLAPGVRLKIAGEFVMYPGAGVLGGGLRLMLEFAPPHPGARPNGGRP